MLRDITLGQYYQAQSPVHALDPRTKLMGTFMYIASLFLMRNFTGYAVVVAFLFLAVSLSQVPFGYMVRGMKAIFVLLSITVLFNLLLTPGEALFTVWKLSVTKEGLRTAAFMGLRLSLLIIGTSLLTLTTTPNNLTDGLEKLLSPLKRLRVPVHEISMMMSIALRFIPILLEETDKIMKAQMARGADFESGNLLHRIRSLVPLLVPLFISAFRRANDHAMAMEARCYRGGEGRTKMKPLVYHKRDILAYMLLILYLALCVGIGRVLPLL